MFELELEERNYAQKCNSAHRFGVSDDAFDRRRSDPQGPLQRIDLLMHGLNAEVGIDAAMEIDDLALCGLAHAHVVDVANNTSFRGEFRQRDLHGRNPVSYTHL